ncbi:hypothetical protein P4O66_000459 [Electrophorus voltai]|uniref:Protein kinase domain-containing protein n=1 Tax=Electrophorus voltai TaxID=2609070 RepID=A0AAD8ZLC5_9TELE|nr:hypothetical protein P4O66_000459 [Electrophorus voltai]
MKKRPEASGIRRSFRSVEGPAEGSAGAASGARATPVPAVGLPKEGSDKRPVSTHGVLNSITRHSSLKAKVESPQLRKAAPAGRSKSFSNHRPLMDAEVIAQVERSSQDIEVTMGMALSELQGLRRPSSVKRAPDVVLDTLEQLKGGGGGGSSEPSSPLRSRLLRDTEPPNQHALHRTPGSASDVPSTFRPCKGPAPTKSPLPPPAAGSSTSAPAPSTSSFRENRPPATRPKPVVFPKGGSAGGSPATGSPTAGIPPTPPPPPPPTDKSFNGINHLRDHGVVHRDIKPGNLVRKVGEDGCSIYKITDFGAARELEDNETFMSLYGTEEYLHPDLYMRAVLRKPQEKSFNVTVDLWSIGVTFYQVATGTLPFMPYGGPRKNQQVMYKIITEKPERAIAGVQKTEGGPIEWRYQLPYYCQLSQGLRVQLEQVLANILESNQEKCWGFDQFFAATQDILQRIKVHVFSLQQATAHCIYVHIYNTVSIFFEEVQAQTGIAPEVQQYMFQGHPLPLDPSKKVAHLPRTTEEQPIFLLSRQPEKIAALPPREPESPVIPVRFDVKADYIFSRTMDGVVHQYLRMVRCLHQHRELILRGFYSHIECVHVECNNTAHKVAMVNMKLLSCLSMEETLREQLPRDFPDASDNMQKLSLIQEKMPMYGSGIREFQGKLQHLHMDLAKHSETLAEDRRNGKYIWVGMGSSAITKSRYPKFEKINLMIYIKRVKGLFREDCLQKYQNVLTAVQTWSSMLHDMQSKLEHFSGFFLQLIAELQMCERHQTKVLDRVLALQRPEAMEGQKKKDHLILRMKRLRDEMELVAQEMQNNNRIIERYRVPELSMGRQVKAGTAVKESAVFSHALRLVFHVWLPRFARLWFLVLTRSVCVFSFGAFNARLVIDPELVSSARHGCGCFSLLHTPHAEFLEAMAWVTLERHLAQHHLDSEKLFFKRALEGQQLTRKAPRDITTGKRAAEPVSPAGAAPASRASTEHTQPSGAERGAGTAGPPRGMDRSSGDRVRVSETPERACVKRDAIADEDGTRVVQHTRADRGNVNGNNNGTPGGSASGRRRGSGKGTSNLSASASTSALCGPSLRAGGRRLSYHGDVLEGLHLDRLTRGKTGVVKLIRNERPRREVWSIFIQDDPRVKKEHGQGHLFAPVKALVDWCDACSLRIESEALRCKSNLVGHFCTVTQNGLMAAVGVHLILEARTACYLRCPHFPLLPDGQWKTVFEVVAWLPLLRRGPDPPGPAFTLPPSSGCGALRWWTHRSDWRRQPNAHRHGDGGGAGKPRAARQPGPCGELDLGPVGVELGSYTAAGADSGARDEGSGGGSRGRGVLRSGVPPLWQALPPSAQVPVVVGGPAPAPEDQQQWGSRAVRLYGTRTLGQAAGPGRGREKHPEMTMTQEETEPGAGRRVERGSSKSATSPSRNRCGKMLVEKTGRAERRNNISRNCSYTCHLHCEGLVRLDCHQGESQTEGTPTIAPCSFKRKWPRLSSFVQEEIQEGGGDRR